MLFLFWLQGGCQHHIGKPDDSIHWCSDFVTHIGQKRGFSCSGLFRFVFCLQQRLFHCMTFGNIKDHTIQPEQLTIFIKKAATVFPYPTIAAITVSQAVFNRVMLSGPDAVCNRFLYLFPVVRVDQVIQIQLMAFIDKIRCRIARQFEHGITDKNQRPFIFG